MSIVLQSSGGGSVTINEPSTASNFTQTLPAGTGSVVVSGINSAITAGTAVASTSGTSIDFTSIPSWVKRITVMFNGVSTNGSSNYLVQIGTGSVTATGYLATAVSINGSSGTSGANSTAGFVLVSVGTGNVLSGQMVLTNISSNSWVSSHYGKHSTTNVVLGGGDIALGGTLDRVRITTVNGTDIFDAGSLNILYE